MTTAGQSAKRSVMQRLWAHWVQLWWIDVPLAGAIVAGVVFIPWLGHHADLLGQLQLNDRRSVYTDLLTLTTIFAGFSTLATATYLGWSSRGVKAVQSIVGKDLLKVWLSATALPWVCSVTVVLVKVTDRGGLYSHNPARWVALATLIILAEQLVRVIFLFYSLAMIEQRPNTPVRRVAEAPIEMKRRGA